MNWSNVLTKVLPVINRSQQCPACGEAFACEIGLQGCWCSEVKVSAAVLEVLRSKYKGCLCRSCLEKAQASVLVEE
jgi:cysteine-rich CWC protein